ncbi:sulfite exporter TauE/SafE family protein [Psychromonas sp. PT13]|uniref:sulfite exporter TauE/SafE family protein n=1 Tax=Psychromonas sp. PT13 TaxID=3439547 RepID=UPI003EB819EF
MEQIWLTIPVVIFAGIVRGFSGFGFAAIAVVGLNLVLTPQQSVALVLSLDLICSINLFKMARQQADIDTLKKLIFGAILGIPIGYCILQLIPAEILKLLICICILGLSLLLLSEFNPFNPKKLKTKIGFGLASGAGTASASVGGPMIVYYMLSSGLNTTTQRATMILFFITSELLAICTLIIGGTVDSTVLKGVLILILPTIIAVQYGQVLFKKKPPQSLKSFALPVMMIVATLGIINSSFILMS